MNNAEAFEDAFYSLRKITEGFSAKEAIESFELSLFITFLCFGKEGGPEIKASINYEKQHLIMIHEDRSIGEIQGGVFKRDLSLDELIEIGRLIKTEGYFSVDFKKISSEIMGLKND